jgi:hypothetical protein
VQFDRPRLLEQVDDGMAVAAEAQRAAGVGERSGVADAVGEIPFRGGAEAHGRVGVAEFGAVGVGEVRGVHRRRTRTEDPGVGQHLGRRAAVVRQARVVLGALLGEVYVQRRLAVTQSTIDGI